MENINPTNASEQQVLEYVKAFYNNIVSALEFNRNGVFMLRPQGDNNLIEKEAINLMKINVNNKQYVFGGITEKFYDEVVKHFEN